MSDSTELNVYQIGFFKYWKNSWLEKYYIVCKDISSESSVLRIKKALKENIDLDIDTQYSRAKESYLLKIDACNTIENLQNLEHWYQTSINLSIKKLNLIE